MEIQFIIVIIIITLLLSAVFSGVEIAYVSANKLYFELKSNRGLSLGLVKFLKSPSKFIATTLIGNTLSLVLYGIFMTSLIEPIIRSYIYGNWQTFDRASTDVIILIVQTIVSTLIVLITAEFLPKSIFISNPNRLVTLFAYPIYIFYYLLLPLVFTVVNLSKWIIVRVFKYKYSEDSPVFGLTDLNQYIHSLIQGSDEPNQWDVDTKIFTNAIEFKTVRVRECMIPRTEIVAVDIQDDIPALKQAFIDSGHSKILLYKESIDEVIGYCHSLELFKKPKNISSILSPIIIVPETMLANELMIQFITEHKSIALVVDEFGGTSGIVTIEDIIEEIFGEINDEHDENTLMEQQVNENVYILSARHEIDYLNEQYGWGIPEGDYDTLGGYLLSITEDIPAAEEEITISKFKFTILSTAETHIDLVKIEIQSYIKSNN